MMLMALRSATHRSRASFGACFLAPSSMLTGGRQRSRQEFTRRIVAHGSTRASKPLPTRRANAYISENEAKTERQARPLAPAIFELGRYLPALGVDGLASAGNVGQIPGQK